VARGALQGSDEVIPEAIDLDLVRVLRARSLMRLERGVGNAGRRENARHPQGVETVEVRRADRRPHQRADIRIMRPLREDVQAKQAPAEIDAEAAVQEHVAHGSRRMGLQRGRIMASAWPQPVRLNAQAMEGRRQ
jgi:hypothetical protein